jgi:hypothetical protein
MANLMLSEASLSVEGAGKGEWLPLSRIVKANRNRSLRLRVIARGCDMNVGNHRWKILWCLGLAVSFPHTARPARAQADFYKGKTISILQGSSPGGTGDLMVQAIMPFLRKYIPGEPTIIREYMPGGGRAEGCESPLRGGSPRRA